MHVVERKRRSRQSFLFQSGRRSIKQNKEKERMKWEQQRAQQTINLPFGTIPDQKSMAILKYDLSRILWM